MNKNDFKESLNHLQWILTIRQGSLIHIPLLGLPCLFSLYQKFPEGKLALIEEVKKVLNIFKGRLNIISLCEQKNKSQAVLAIKVTCTFNKIVKVIEIIFKTNGCVSVNERTV